MSTPLGEEAKNETERERDYYCKGLDNQFASKIYGT